MRPLRWASWIAVSSQPQAADDKISIPHQRQLNLEHCTRHGGRLVAELLVPGESRSIPAWEEACAEVEAYAQLRDLIRSRTIDVLAFYDRTRLGRMASLIMTIEALCLRAGIALYETTNPPAEISASYQYERQLIGAIGAVGAQHEVQKLVERRRIGIANRVRRGEFAGRPNWGYRYVYDTQGRRSVVVDDAAAHVVRTLFDLFLAGNGTIAVAHELNASGYRSPTGKPWIKSMVRVILRSAPAYAGYAEANKKSRKGAPLVRGRGAWQPIIDEATMREVHQEMAARTANRHLPGASGRFSSACYCAHCGALMTYQRTTNSTGTRYVYLVCTRHVPRAHVREERIVEALEAAIRRVAGGELQPAPLDTDALERLRAGLADVDRRRENLRAAYGLADNAHISGRMDIERYDAQIALLRSQEAALEADCRRLQAALAVEEERGPREQRMIDVGADGLRMLHAPDVQAANIWLRRRLRVWCDAHAVAYVEVLP